LRPRFGGVQLLQSVSREQARCRSTGNKVVRTCLEWRWQTLYRFLCGKRILRSLADGMASDTFVLVVPWSWASTACPSSASTALHRGQTRADHWLAWRRLPSVAAGASSLMGSNSTGLLGALFGIPDVSCGGRAPARANLSGKRSSSRDEQRYPFDHYDIDACYPRASQAQAFMAYLSSRQTGRSTGELKPRSVPLTGTCRPTCGSWRGNYVRIGKRLWQRPQTRDIPQREEGRWVRMARPESASSGARRIGGPGSRLDEATCAPERKGFASAMHRQPIFFIGMTAPPGSAYHVKSQRLPRFAWATISRAASAPAQAPVSCTNRWPHSRSRHSRSVIRDAAEARYRPGPRTRAWRGVFAGWQKGTCPFTRQGKGTQTVPERCAGHCTRSRLDGR